MLKVNRSFIALGVMVAMTAMSSTANAQNSMPGNGYYSVEWNATDTNIDGSISRNEFKHHAASVFNTSDTDNNGMINKDEGYAVMRLMMGSGNGVNGGINPGMFSRRWVHEDTNHDGVISASENVAYNNRLFNLADANTDARLSRGEWQTLLPASVKVETLEMVTKSD